MSRRILLSNCKHCGNEFELDVKNRKYCSQECFREYRKISHRPYCREWSRRRDGTYEKWIGELEKAGYKVTKI